jgi:hypothetical protein
VRPVGVSQVPEHYQVSQVLDYKRNHGHYGHSEGVKIVRVFNKIEKTVWEISDEGTLKHLRKYPERYEIGPAKEDHPKEIDKGEKEEKPSKTGLGK